MRQRINVADAHKRKPDTEAKSQNVLVSLKYKRPDSDILSGVTWKCSMRSAFYWFAEFCHSQSLSHFAASFIVAWAETSIAKSCKEKKNELKFIKKVSNDASLIELKTLPTRIREETKRLPQAKWLVIRLESCNWSFRRFTYGNLVTTSPSSKQ